MKKGKVLIGSSKNPFESAYAKLVVMENEKKVDLSILDDFKILTEWCGTGEKHWKDSKQLPIKEAFVLFHSMRNCRMILQKMGLRFRLAKERYQNPQIVYSARLVLPRINDLYNMIDSLKERKVTHQILDLIRQRLKMLRDVAESTAMLPTPEEETRGVLSSELKKKFEIVAHSLQAKISEE